MKTRTKPSVGIIVEPYRHAYCDAVPSLIVSIQHDEFGIPITVEDQPDLKNIPGVYQKDKGNFWLALENTHLIGTIALIDVGGGVGVIRKMFVAQEYRGSGVAQRLLDTLIEWARVKGFTDLYLGTVNKFEAAQRFYEKNEFKLIDNDALPPAIDQIRMPLDNKHYHRVLPL